MPKKSTDPRNAKNPEMKLTYFFSFALPLTRLEIRICSSDKGAIAKVKAYGFPPRQEEGPDFDDWPRQTLLAKAETKVLETTYKKAWCKIVELCGTELGDYEGPPMRTDCPTGRVDLKWEGGKNSFGGYDLKMGKPYKTIVKVIEGVAKNALNKVYDKVYKVEEKAEGD